MKIPKSFKLFGKTVKVKQVRNLNNDQGWQGEANYKDGTIKIQKNCDGYTLSEDLREQIFYHELVHHILVNLGENDLNSNEQFVDTFSSLLHQSIKTSRY